ncbi:MAG TPA: 6-phospho-beta-glucosidase [Candidatus Limnocylindrales bacterium]|nr:6-phospho-beta-glucosidase [Candidatus Limnocylindrales bacterium]
MGVKIAVVGGGSTYTPELIEGFAVRNDRLPVDELVLLDIDPERREVVGGLAGRMLDRFGWGGRLVLTDDADAAIDGADFILIQLRVGGQAARFVDETLPLRFGTIGQETTGAGGFAKALRTVPVVLDLAERAARRAAKDHWIVDFTNPVGIVSQALLDDGHRAIGLCNVAIGFQRRFAQQFGVPPERVELEHVGLNHLTWERAIRVDGVDRLPELLEADGREIADDVGLPLELLMALKAIPSYYLRYYYLFDTVLADQRSDGHGTRAEEVIKIEQELLEMYRNPALTEKPELLTRRGGAFYSEAAAQLIASLHDGAGDVQIVNVKNAGALPDLSPDAVVEIPARIDRDGAHPLPLRPLDPDMRGLVQSVKGYEELTIAAARTGDREIALRALLANPLVRHWEIARPLLDALLAANEAHLPRFAPR